MLPSPALGGNPLNILLEAGTCSFVLNISRYLNLDSYHIKSQHCDQKGVLEWMSSSCIKYVDVLLFHYKKLSIFLFCFFFFFIRWTGSSFFVSWRSSESLCVVLLVTICVTETYKSFIVFPIHHSLRLMLRPLTSLVFSWFSVHANLARWAHFWWVFNCKYSPHRGVYIPEIALQITNIHAIITFTVLEDLGWTNSRRSFLFLVSLSGLRCCA